jgi:hypothetical protein
MAEVGAGVSEVHERAGLALIDACPDKFHNPRRSYCTGHDWELDRGLQLSSPSFPTGISFTKRVYRCPISIRRVSGHLQANSKQPTIGKLINEAMAEIEKANPGLKGVLPKDYNRPALDACASSPMATDTVSALGA